MPTPRIMNDIRWISGTPREDLPDSLKSDSGEGEPSMDQIMDDIRRVASGEYDTDASEASSSETEKSVDQIMDEIRQMATGEHPALRSQKPETEQEKAERIERTILREIAGRARQYLDKNGRDDHAFKCMGFDLHFLRQHRAKSGFEYDPRLDPKRVSLNISRNIPGHDDETVTDYLKAVAYQAQLLVQSTFLRRMRSLEGLQAALDEYDVFQRLLDDKDPPRKGVKASQPTVPPFPQLEDDEGNKPSM